MASLLQRYLHGEQREVWAELLGLGQEVRQKPRFTEAMAVARETMFRVRYNICLLVSRLEAIGYQFGYQWAESILRDEDKQIARMKSPEGLAEDLRAAERSFRRKQLNEEDIQRRLAIVENATLHVESPTRRLFATFPPPALQLPPPHVHDLLQEVETSIGIIPLSLYAWYELIGSVNFIGNIPDSWLMTFRQMRPKASQASTLMLDPLFVDSLDDFVNEVRKVRPYTMTGIRIAPDKYLKDACSGGGEYAVSLPNGDADVPLLVEEHHTTFVQYLRICFQWGGFPGLANWNLTGEQLAYVREGLLPI